MTIYLANIHLVFRAGAQGMMGLPTPLSAVGALAIVLAAISAFGSDVRVITLGVSIYYGLSAAVSFWLRRRTHEPGASFGPSVPYLTAAGLISATWATFYVADWIGWVIFGVVGLVVVASEGRRSGDCHEVPRLRR